MKAGLLRWFGAALLLAAAAAPARAQRSLEIPRFDSRVVVDPDGSIVVSETITARFHGKWNGIYRKVPVKYRTPQGFNWTIRISLLGATDLEGNALRTETSREGHYLRFQIWVPGAEDAERTIVLSYRATNALRFFENHDELYWNLTGDEWDVPLGLVSAEVHLPAGVTGVRATAFNGVLGAALTEAQVDASGPVVTIRMPRSLEFREGVTAVVGWDKGFVAEPTAVDRAAGFLLSNWPLIIPILAFLGMFGLWRSRGRDPERRPVAVRYEPPVDYTPAEAGSLTDEKVDMRDVTATLVDLAVRGYLRIEQTEESALFGLVKSEEYVFHRLRPETEWASLPLHEQRLLRGVFKKGDATVKLSDLKEEFYTELSGIRDAVLDRLMSKRVFRVRPDRTRNAWTVGGVAIGILVIAAGSMSAAYFSLTPLPAIIAGVLTAIVVIVFGRLMPARTVAGTRALEQVLGFEEFLERVEGERFRDVTLTPEMFERFLPWAMAFGVEQKWARAFDDVRMQPPTWYAGVHPSAFNASSFSRSLSSMSSQAATSMSSAPRTSSGSGFSGGSSGGGGGGGGGGGF
jgi:uncharacterized membrane protein